MRKATRKCYSICEYGVVRKAKDFRESTSSLSELYLQDSEFDSFYDYVLANQPLEGDTPFSIFSKGNKIQIKVKNYVGLIETSDGLSLEILPKITAQNEAVDIAVVKGIFLKMLRTLKNSPFLTVNEAHLSSKENFPILEVFIRSYIQEAEKLISMGLRNSYVLKEDNLSFLRGRICATKTIKFNSFNKSRFHCEFSELSEDNAQNRIIKTAIFKLLSITRNYVNYSSLSKLLVHFENVKISHNISTDLHQAFITNRLFTKYQKILEWSSLFLENKGIANFSGNSLNIAILFPMEKLFEDYISYLFKKYTNGYRVSTQHRSYFLVERHLNAKRFQLIPDLYLEKTSIERIIIDTKWKLIDEKKYSRNYDIKIGDMYQLFAYGKKYTDEHSVPRLAIIYPRNEYFTKKLDSFDYDSNLKLNVFPFDFLKDEKTQIDEIIGFVN